MEGNITSTYKFNMFRCDVHFLHKAEEENRQDMVDNVAKLGDPKEKSAMPSISATFVGNYTLQEVWVLISPLRISGPLEQLFIPKFTKKILTDEYYKKYIICYDLERRSTITRIHCVDFWSTNLPLQEKQKCVNTLGPCQNIDNNELKTKTLSLIKYRGQL